MSDRSIIIVSILLLAFLVVLAMNYNRITGNALFENSCQPYSRQSLQAFNEDENVLGKVSVAVGDVNLDGKKDIITGSGDASNSRIRVFSIYGKNLLGFAAFDKDENPNGDVYVAAGDFDEDTIMDIAAGTGNLGGSLVRVFDHDGDEITTITAFNEIENPSGKVSVAIADLDGNKRPKLIVGSGNGGSSLIRIFDNDGNTAREFKAFTGQNSGGEIFVAAGDVIGDEKNEIVAGTGKDGNSRVAIFDHRGKRLKEFKTIESRNGLVPVAVGDFVFGDKKEIIVGSGKDSNVLNVYATNGKILYKIQPFANNNPGGEIFVAAGNILANKKDEIIASTGLSGTSYVDVIEIKCGVDLTCEDKDNDGSCYTDDCLDINAKFYPGALESCDNLDNDCNGLIDNGCGQ